MYKGKDKEGIKAEKVVDVAPDANRESAEIESDLGVTDVGVTIKESNRNSDAHGDKKKFVIAWIGFGVVLLAAVIIYFVCLHGQGETRSNGRVSDESVNSQDSQELEADDDHKADGDEQGENSQARDGYSYTPPTYRKILDFDSDDMEAALRSQILVLHRSEQSESQEDLSVFTFYRAYTYVTELYANILTDYQKNEMIIHAMVQDGLAGRMSEYLPEDFSDGSGWEQYFDNGSAISGNELAEYYHKVFGEAVQHGEDMHICGNYHYSEQYNVYYLYMAGCGGHDAMTYKGRMMNFRVEGDIAKVDIFVASLYDNYAPDSYGGQTKVALLRFCLANIQTQAFLLLSS